MNFWVHKYVSMSPYQGLSKAMVKKCSFGKWSVIEDDIDSDGKFVII